MSQESDYVDDEEYDYDYDENVSEDEADEEEERAEVVKSSGTSSSTTTSPKKNIDVIQNGATNKTLNFLEILEISGKRISEVASLLELNPNVAQFLLQRHSWNQEKIMEGYFSDCEKLMSSAGLDLYKDDQVITFFPINNVKKYDEKVSFMCKVCYDEFDDVIKDGFSLGCGHTFCKDCFRQYLTGQVNDGIMCIQSHCPEHKCKQAITCDVYHAFLSTELKEKYNKFVTKHFVEFTKNMRFCPAANCEKVILCSEGYNRTITCDCTHAMCFKCGEEAHEPASCQQLQTWSEKCASDGESSKWIFANTKKCPKCHTRIEKNQGCLHMICHQCKHNFCWICMGTHHVWVCNEFKPTVDETAELNAQQMAKVELERYHHFFNRYHNHDQALKFASKQRTEALQKMKEMQEKQSDAWIDVQYVTDAVDTVVLCRRVLKYTYVIGYYMPEHSPEKLLFERHQEMLEENTEKLHECTEGQNVFTADRTQVVNWTRITERFRKSLLDSYIDGMSAGAHDESAVPLEQIDRWIDTTKGKGTRAKPIVLDATPPKAVTGKAAARK